MSREIEFFGVLMPALLPLFVGTLLVWWPLDTLLGRFSVYTWVWHPPLVRICVFICLFVGAAWALGQ